MSKRKPSFEKNTLVVSEALDDTAYDVVKIVSDNMDSVLIVSTGMPDVSAVSAISTEIIIVAGDTIAINSLYTDKAILDSIYADKATLDSLFADKITLDSIYADKIAIDAVYNNRNNINTVATNETNINVVSGISANVTTVANIASDVSDVAANNIDVSIVALAIANVNTVGANINNVNTVAGDTAAINSLVTDKTTLDSLYADKATLDSIYADKATIDAVHANATNINSAVTNETNITTVAGSIANINTVASIENLNNITTVAEDLNALDLNGIADVTIVADDLVLGALSLINQTASNMTDINAVVTNETNINTVATNITDVNNFADTYHGALAVAPTIGSHPSLSAGDLYFDTALEEMRVFDGSVWKASGSTINGTSKRQSYTAAAAQTFFVVTEGYDPNFADVYRNGIKLTNGVDVDVSTGTDFTITIPCTLNDEIDFIGYGAFVLADHYTKTESDILHTYVPMEIKADEPLASLDCIKVTSYTSGTDSINASKTVAQTDICVGIARSSISTGQSADIVTKGMITDVNTSGWVFGTILYSGALGALTDTKPSGTYQAVAFVVKDSSGQGAIMVDIGEPVVPVVINNTLTSTSTTEALSANQGKNLKDTADTLATTVGTKVGSVQEGGVGTLAQNILIVTQAQYDGLTPDANTVYYIT